jgi:hypothetical protein
MASDAAAAMEFYEVFWHGEAIGDAGDFDEALASYGVVKPEDGDWAAACGEAQPEIQRYSSFEAFLDNDEALETIPVNAAMIEAAVAQTPPAASS